MKTKHNRNKTLQHFEGMAFNLTQLSYVLGGCCDQGGQTDPDPPGSNGNTGNTGG